MLFIGGQEFQTATWGQTYLVKTRRIRSRCTIGKTDCCGLDGRCSKARSHAKLELSKNYKLCAIYTPLMISFTSTADILPSGLVCWDKFCMNILFTGPGKRTSSKNTIVCTPSCGHGLHRRNKHGITTFSCAWRLRNPWDGSPHSKISKQNAGVRVLRVILKQTHLKLSTQIYNSILFAT